MRIFIFTLIIFSFSCNETPPKSTTSIMTKIKKIDWQGHRGARGILPENTIPAFLKALEYPVTTLELDIAISKDNKVIVTHEPWFNHAISSHPDGTPVTKEEEKNLLIYEMTYEELQKYDVGIRGNVRFPNQTPMKVSKPSLADMVKTVDAHCEKTGRAKPNYDIEVKSKPDYYGKKTPHPAEYVRLILEEVENLGIKNRSNLQSFDLNVLEEIHKQSPTTIIAYLVENVQPSKEIMEKTPIEIAKYLIENSDSPEENLKKISFKPDIYSPFYMLLNKEIVASMHAQNIRVIPWTVNTKEDMKRMIEFGVDGIITDYPNYIE